MAVYSGGQCIPPSPSHPKFQTRQKEAYPTKRSVFLSDKDFSPSVYLTPPPGFDHEKHSESLDENDNVFASRPRSKTRAPKLGVLQKSKSLAALKYSTSSFSDISDDYERSRTPKVTFSNSIEVKDMTKDNRKKDLSSLRKKYKKGKSSGSSGIRPVLKNSPHTTELSSTGYAESSDGSELSEAASVSSCRSFPPVTMDDILQEYPQKKRRKPPRFSSVGRMGSMSSSQLLRQASMPANQTNWTPPPEIIRTVVLAKTKKGYGFVLRGAKAEQLKKLNMQFVPSERMPALQYLDSVEKGSVSDKAGLNAGDFILEIDNINVTHASHEQTVAIIKKAGDVLQMKVIRSVRVDNEKNKVDNRSNGMMTLPSRKSSAHDVPDAPRVNMKNGHADEEAMAIDHFINEQLDATLANYDSDSRSSSSGTAPAQVSKDLKIASIRQRPSSSHFNSIQELDDMFSENAAENPYSQPFMQLPAEPKQEPVRKPDAGVDLDQLTPPTPISVPPPPSFPPPLPDEHAGSVVTKAIIDTPPPPPPLNQSENTSAFQSSNHNSPAEAPPIPPANAFADAIKQAADNRSKRPVSELPPADKPARDDIYATVNKRPVSTNNINDKPNNAPGVGTGLSVEDQLRLAVAKRRNQIERRGDSSTSESEKSTSVTPERTLSQPAVSSTEPNFRELAEIKRQEWVKRQKDESNNNTTNEKELPPLPPPVIKPPTEEKKSPASDSMSELQKIMNRLAVSSAQTTQQTTQQPEPQPQKKRPPPVFKKPPRQVQKPENLSPLDEFPPPPPLDFAGEMQSGETTSNLDVIVPPPVFDPPTSQFSPNYGSSVSHDTDNHSVSSSVGSDTISSVSQDGNRTSIATSGYHSDSNRSPSAASSATSKLSDKSVESWTVDNVGVWLDSIGLSEYKQVFSENCIEGDTLISMTKQDISELGVNKIGHKVKLDKEIKKLMPEG